jgi:predicted DNA-binding WGR domain protein
VILLHRINPERNERRFYLVATGPTLLDTHAVQRTWGRIGGGQRCMITPCADEVEAGQVAARIVKAKVKGGYKIMSTILPANDRELVLFYEAYDLGARAGLAAARLVIERELKEELEPEAARILGRAVSTALQLAEALRGEVDGKIRALLPAQPGETLDPKVVEALRNWLRLNGTEGN